MVIIGSFWPFLALTVSLGLSLALIGSQGTCSARCSCCVRELYQALVVVMHLAFLPKRDWFQNIPNDSKLFCCKTIKYNSALVPNIKIWYFLLQNAKIQYFLLRNVKTLLFFSEKRFVCTIYIFNTFDICNSLDGIWHMIKHGWYHRVNLTRMILHNLLD